MPEHQRRSLTELTGELDLRAGDAAAKRSAFWIFLALSAVIATAGVLADSTATVIGAMIIAPLSTPIMGIALGLAKGSRDGATSSLVTVLVGAAGVVVVGVLLALVMPRSWDLLANAQVAGRTSPGALDLLAAIATGFAGAIALARRDVAAVLPGVAIAISLVPPLAVVGVCLGHGAPGLALGALLLFLSNLLALVLAGTLVFAATGYTAEAAAARGRRRAARPVVVLLVLVALPLVANSAGAYYVTVMTGRVQTAAEDWLRDAPGAAVEGVEVTGGQIRVTVRTPGTVPTTAPLVDRIDDAVPGGFPITVVTSVGEEIDARADRTP
ncbi:MAG: TIGR00341 family protein [Actinotalea sp.]|nr:TIGR00341 family protein [Actinotalea sp.]